MIQWPSIKVFVSPKLIVRGGIKFFKFGFAKKGSTPMSVIIPPQFIKIRSMCKDKFGNMCAQSQIT